MGDVEMWLDVLSGTEKISGPLIPFMSLMNAV